MLENLIKNACNNLDLHPKPFKFNCKSSSYQMSFSRRCPVNPSTHTFCNIDVTQAIAYWWSQKIVAYYENIIRNLERVFKLFWNTILSLCRWFFFQAIVWSIMKAGRSSLKYLFQCVRQVGFEFCKTCSHYNICFKYEANTVVM